MSLINPLVQYKGDIFEAQGKLQYSYDRSYGYKLIVDIDPGIGSFYRSLIPKWFQLNKPKYPAHISVVRHEVPKKLENWNKYQGKEIDFKYSNYLNQGTVYWWLNAFCRQLEEVRLELGLPVSSQYTLPPEGFVKCFHITVANCKGIP